MNVSATAKQISHSPQKLRIIGRAIKGLTVEEALIVLRYHPSPWARVVSKVVQSATANAANNYQLDPQELHVADVNIGDGVPLKRFRPRARGRVAQIKKRHSHITVTVNDERN